MPTAQYPTYVSNVTLQKSFASGIDTLSSDTAIADDGYQVLLNARQRFGYIEPIKKHVKDTAFSYPTDIKQGIFGIGNVLIVFSKGSAYYKVEGTTNWIKIVGFTLSETVTNVYAEAVPASFMNFIRYSSASDISTITKKLGFAVAGTPACVVVQDGVSQPQLIFFVGDALIARPAHTYNQWNNVSSTENDREYVPIGKQMLYLGTGILLIVSPDGKSIYRSVTGRPLDFMVNVDSSGNKLDSEQQGGAASVSFAFDYDEITCIAPVNIQDSFAYCTQRTIRIGTADFTNTIFGEPLFNVSAIIQAGVVNQYSFTELVGIGDYAFIDFEGVISFNAVQTYRFNGRNSIFSLPLSKVLKDIRQANPCCINWSNYSLFALDTIWGNCIAAFDNIQQKWSAFDVNEVSNIKQFALTETTDATYIYCITQQNEIYKLFSSENGFYTPTLFTKAFVATETNTEHKSQHLRLLFNSGTVAGKVSVTEYVDGQASDITITKDLNEAPEPVDIVAPFLSDTAQNVDNPSYHFKNGSIGKKIAYVISWTNDAKLIEFELTTSWKKSDSSVQETEKKMKNNYGG